MTLVDLFVSALPLCIAGLFEAGNIGSSSGVVVTTPTATPTVALRADFSSPNYYESWVFW